MAGKFLDQESAVKPVISILITTWNTRDLTVGLLDSIVKNPPGVPFEVIVVDNASVDSTVAEIGEKFPKTILVKNHENVGYARGNNQAYRVSAGEYILLLGSDTVIIDKGMWGKMVDYLNCFPKAGAVSCRLLNPDRSPQRSCRRFPTLWDGVMTYLSLDRLAPHYTMIDFDYYKTQEVEQPAATCLMLRRHVVEQIGLFDERYTILYNDVDLCRRIWSDGWKIVYLADAEIIHHGSKSTTQAPPRLRLEMYRNILLYYSTTVGIIAKWVLLPILVARLFAATRSTIAFQLFLSQDRSST